MVSCSSRTEKTVSFKTEVSTYNSDSSSRLSKVVNYNEYGNIFQELFYDKNEKLININSFVYFDNQQIKYKHRYHINKRHFQTDTFLYKGNQLIQSHTLPPFRNNDKELIIEYQDDLPQSQIEHQHFNDSKTSFKIEFVYDNENRLTRKSRYEFDDNQIASSVYDYWTYEHTEKENKIYTIAKSYLGDSLVLELSYIDSLNENKTLAKRTFESQSTLNIQ